MSKRPKPPAESNDEIKFQTIAREVNLLVKRLTAKGICGGCICHGLIFHGAYLFADLAGVEEAVSLCMDVADSLGSPDEAGKNQSIN